MVRVKKIFSREIALELKTKGHELLYTEPNREKVWLSVFCFKETKELLNDLTELTRKEN